MTGATTFFVNCCLLLSVAMLALPTTLHSFRQNLWESEDSSNAMFEDDDADSFLVAKADGDRDEGRERRPSEADEGRGRRPPGPDETVSTWASSGSGSWDTQQGTSTFVSTFEIPWASSFDLSAGDKESTINAVTGELVFYSTYLQTFIYSTLNYWHSSGEVTLNGGKHSSWSSSGSSWSTVTSISSVTTLPPITTTSSSSSSSVSCESAVSADGLFWVSSGLSMKLAFADATSEWAQSWGSSWTAPFQSNRKWVRHAAAPRGGESERPRRQRSGEGEGEGRQASDGERRPGSVL